MGTWAQSPSFGDPSTRVPPEAEGSHLLSWKSRPGSHQCLSLYQEEMWLTSAGDRSWRGYGGSTWCSTTPSCPGTSERCRLGALGWAAPALHALRRKQSGRSVFPLVLSSPVIPWLALVKTPPARRFVLKAAWRFFPDLMACGWTYCGLPSNRNTIM